MTRTLLLNPLLPRVLLFNPLLPKVFKATPWYTKLPMYVCFECWLAPMEFKQAFFLVLFSIFRLFFDTRRMFRHSSLVKKYVEKISKSTWKKKRPLKFHFRMPTFPTDVHKWLYHHLTILNLEEMADDYSDHGEFGDVSKRFRKCFNLHSISFQLCFEYLRLIRAVYLRLFYFLYNDNYYFSIKWNCRLF